ncbi:serine/threonineprotein kinase [Thraustotheca clavata]|uniref:Serine/threonineprotein kinase n=1 Tax=Thraustotheca clavata TaxID=74557 RepID=A0A1V9ZWZ1_9STRA|nr:serine/threonineprotein kinase [Thraustotheca clavata]
MTSQCSEADLKWLESVIAKAPVQSTSSMENQALKKYLKLNAIKYSPSLDVQTCVFVAYQTAVLMASMKDIKSDDIAVYGRVLSNLFPCNDTFKKVMPDWFANLAEQCKLKIISTAADIVQEFKKHGADYKLSHCKIHQGIPVVVTEHADNIKLKKVKVNDREKDLDRKKDTWTQVDSTEFPANVKTLDRNSLLFMTENFISRTRFVVTTREKYEGEVVTVYRVTNTNLLEGKTIKDMPAFCQYLNLRLRLKSEYINPVIGIIDVGKKDDASKKEEAPCIVFECNSKTTLFQYLVDANVFKQYLIWGKRLRIALDIAKGLSYLHDNGVVHKMLNPFTVSISNNLSIKLTSFGMEATHQTTGTSGGNWSNAAPEVRRNNDYTTASDIFDFGLILMELAGYRVHNNSDFGEVLSMSTTTCPRWYQELVQVCTEQDPNERPNIKDILLELEKHLNDYFLDAPRNSVALMELEKDQLTQSAVVNSLSDDISIVYGGIYKGMDVLIKRPNDNPKNKNITPIDHLFNEVVISTRVQSQNIVNQYGVLDCNNSSPAVVIANMNYGSLHDYISRVEDKNTFDQSIKLHIAISVAQALMDLHEFDYVHCNVDTRNVFMSSNRQVKLGNLSLAQPEGMLLSDVLFEYIQYLAPEVKEGKPFTKSADVYAFGKLLVALELCEQEAGDQQVNPAWCKDLIKMCCSDDAMKRPKIEAVVKKMKNLRDIAPVNFLQVKLKGIVDVSEQLKSLTSIESGALTYKEVIGSGAFGSIQKGVYDGNEVAIKVFKNETKTDANKANDFAREARVLYECQKSEHVVKLLGVNVKERQIIMELMDEDLGEYIKKMTASVFTWQQRLDIAVQTSKALADLHKYGIVHLDVKSFNYLIKHTKEGIILKIADFGQAHVIEETWGNLKNTTEVANLGVVGTVGWKAPELIKKAVFVEQITKIDIYALGAIFYELETLQVPKPKAEDVPDQMYEKNILHREIKLQLARDDCPFKNTANKCLFAEPARRPSADRLVVELENLLVKE